MTAACLPHPWGSETLHICAVCLHEDWLEERAPVCPACASAYFEPAETRHWWQEIPDDDDDDDDVPYPGYEDCGLMHNGQCSKAGSEECDWDCGALR